MVAALTSLEILLSFASGLTADSMAPPTTAPARPSRLAFSVVARYTTESMIAPTTSWQTMKQVPSKSISVTGLLAA